MLARATKGFRINVFRLGRRNGVGQRAYRNDPRHPKVYPVAKGVH